MAISEFNHVKISCISVIIPDNYIYKAEDYIHLFDNSEKKLARAKKMAGYGTRYFSPENITAVDACETAAKDLIDNNHIDKDTIDALIFVSQVPDYRTPASASVLHGRLNMPETCAVFDVNQGCTGYVYGLWLASSLIESKACKKVLLLASDNKTNTNWIPDKVYDKNALIFSSGASATLLEYSENEIKSYYLTGSDGSKYETIISPFGSARIPYTYELLNTFVQDRYGNKHSLSGEYMDGNAVFYFSINRIPNHVRELLEYSQNSYDDIDFFAIHQANKQIVEAIAADLQLPADKYSSDTFVNYGNMAGISCLSNLLDIKSADLNTKQNKIALISFGVGLSWASAVINLGHDTYSNNICNQLDCYNSIASGGGEFVMKHYLYKEQNTYQELLLYWKNKLQQHFDK